MKAKKPYPEQDRANEPLCLRLNEDQWLRLQALTESMKAENNQAAIKKILDMAYRASTNAKVALADIKKRNGYLS